MDTILVVNAGSSSVKFQVFAIERGGGLKRRIKGQVDGIGTRPRLRASTEDSAAAVDQTLCALAASVCKDCADAAVHGLEAAPADGG